MNENILKEKNFISPPAHRRYQSNNNLYMNYIINRNSLPNNNNIVINNENINNDLDINEDNNYYPNIIRTSRYNYNINNINNSKNYKISNNINNYIDLLQKQNISLQSRFKKMKRELVLKDNEIDGFKEKVKALLQQVKDKNIDLDKKRNVILKLNEEKEINNINQIQNNNNINNTEYNLLKIQLQISNREKEKLIKENQYLKAIIQKLNINNYNLKKGKNINFLYEQNYNEDDKSSDFDNNNIIHENNNLNNLVINNFGLSIKGNVINNNKDQLLLQKDLQIKKLNKIIEELKNKNEIQVNKYKIEIEEINNNKKYIDSILQNKEKQINELLKNNNDLKEENNILSNNLKENINELNEMRIKKDLSLNEEKNTDNSNIIIINQKINLENEIREKNMQNEELQNKIVKINDEILNKERMIEELNEDIENLKEINEYSKKEINEKNNIIEKLNNEKNDIENKNKEILKQNGLLNKDNEKLYADNVKLKNSVNKLNEDIENEQNLKDQLEKEKNNIKIKNDQLTNDKKELVEKIISIEENNNNIKTEIEKLKKTNNELMEQIKNNQNKNISEKEESILNAQSKKTKSENENNINNNIDSNNNDNRDINEIKKENKVFQEKIIKLNECIGDLNNQLNTLNIKYKEQKKENNDLKEVSKALLDKQKNDLLEKDKNEHISPETHYIITKKVYNKLIWYLISTVNPYSKDENEINNYKNYKWVTELIIPKAQLNKYYNLENGVNQIDNFISNRDYGNKKTNRQSQNNTANTNIIGGTLFLNKILNNDKSNNINKSNSNHNYTNKFNANSSLGREPTGDLGKYKNLLDKLNDYGEREIKLQNEISKLRTQLKDKENFQAGMNNIKDISQHFDSNFIDDKDDKNAIIELLSNTKIDEKKKGRKIRDEDNFLNILNDVPGSESDLDEVKGLKKLITYLKSDIKEKERIINELIKQVKEIFKELKWSTKNNKIVTEILKILGYSPEIIKIIFENRNGYNFDFDLQLKK